MVVLGTGISASSLRWGRFLERRVPKEFCARPAVGAVPKIDGTPVVSSFRFVIQQRLNKDSRRFKKKSKDNHQASTRLPKISQEWYLVIPGQWNPPKLTIWFVGTEQLQRSRCVRQVAPIFCSSVGSCWWSTCSTWPRRTPFGPAADAPTFERAVGVWWSVLELILCA